MAHLADRAYPTLSGGEQARVQFARVLCQLEAGRTVADRQVLVLDGGGLVAGGRPRS
ncbi:hypothetical protein [Methylobacterium mesophilicum]|uniref:hypothetical protein n=1 Tax=Methylobacterium mesophilicum TaxID=39956 RepID=UPI002F35B09F